MLGTIVGAWPSSVAVRVAMVLMIDDAKWREEVLDYLATHLRCSWIGFRKRKEVYCTPTKEEHKLL